MKRFTQLGFTLALSFVSGCSQPPAEKPAPPAPAPIATEGTCKGAYPSYWQDAAFANTGMWEGQTISNQPPSDWKGPVFRLSQAYPSVSSGDAAARGWTRFDPFKKGLSAKEKEEQAMGYSWAVMDYIQEGNVTHGAEGGDVEQDWTMCGNPARPWFHMPYQTYDPLSGREFMHGLTREAPVQFTLTGGKTIATTMWAVGFYNGAGGQTLGSVWKPNGVPDIPSDNLQFPDGTVVGKLLFTTATPAELPFLANMPKWRINMSQASFCSCKSSAGGSCTFQEMSQQCPRTPGEVYLAQFDVAVRDSRSPSGWVFGTFVADGQEKAGEKNPWKRISSLGLMWTNDTPPAGTGAISYPADPRKNGFPDEVIFWDVVDRLNRGSNAGHLGCNSRLNGPADNARSSCLSCHMTASVPDQARVTPPIFNLSAKGQCANPPNLGPDGVYFASTRCGASFMGGAVVPPPNYASGRKEWISTDFSLQLSISLAQYGEWIQTRTALEGNKETLDRKGPAFKLDSALPAR